MHSIPFRASKSQPCPVCGEGTKNCSATSDGLHFCRGEPRNGWRRIGEDEHGFGHYRREDDPPPQVGQKPVKPKPTRWPTLTKRYTEALIESPQHRERLGQLLGLPSDVFEAFSLGLCGSSSDGADYSIPERNGEGAIIGLATRIERAGKKASKRCITDSKRGLTIPVCWRDNPGPVLIVEGFTDTAALTAAGLSSIGRPSNLSGSKMLGQLLKNWPPERGIIVVGENDANGAGLDGAIRVSTKLSALLGRIVPYALPSAEAKDVREWLTAETRLGMNWKERGIELLKILEANAQ